GFPSRFIPMQAGRRRSQARPRHEARLALVYETILPISSPASSASSAVRSSGSGLFSASPAVRSSGPRLFSASPAVSTSGSDLSPCVLCVLCGEFFRFWFLLRVPCGAIRRPPAPRFSLRSLRYWVPIESPVGPPAGSSLRSVQKHALPVLPIETSPSPLDRDQLRGSPR